MQKLIKILFRDKAILVAISLTFIITYLSLKSVSHNGIVYFAHIDKVYHSIAYFSLALFWLLGFPKALDSQMLKFGLGVACVVFGIVIEVLQATLTAYRTASLLDVLANAIGVAVAMMVYRYFSEKIMAI